MAERVDLSKLEPMTSEEFRVALEPTGLLAYFAGDPVDGLPIIVMDWQDVSRLVKHYEKLISDLEEKIDAVPYSY